MRKPRTTRQNPSLDFHGSQGPVTMASNFRTRPRELRVSLSGPDRVLLKRCLHHEAGAWNDFVDRFLGLVYHVIHHTAHLRSVPLQPEDTEDLAAEILLQIVANDYAVLRQFRGQSSLATYLTVIARRTCIHQLSKQIGSPLGRNEDRRLEDLHDDQPSRGQSNLETLEEVGKLLKKLPTRERSVVQLYFIEGRSYEEISTQLNIPVNSVGAILSRARKKLRGETKRED